MPAINNDITTKTERSPAQHKTRNRKSGLDGLLTVNNTRKYHENRPSVDVQRLQLELKHAIQGEVRFDSGSRAMYATDASNYRQVPIGVVIPKSREDIIKTVALCRKYNAPVLSRGGGTSLAGQCCNVAVVMDMSKYFNRILKIDKEAKTVTVEAGIVLDEVRQRTVEECGLTFGPDPATHSHCTIGGMIGNDSCGIHSVLAKFDGNGARTADNIHSMTVLTYDGEILEVGQTTDEQYEEIFEKGGRKAEIYKALRDIREHYALEIRSRFPDIPRRVSGYNLPQLLPENKCNVARALAGSEGTCVTILEATLDLLDAPKVRSLLVLGYKDLYTSGHAIPEILKHQPIGLEGIDDLLVEYMRRKDLNVKDLPLLPQGNAWLLVEFGGDTRKESDDRAKALMKELETHEDPPNMSLFDDPEQEQKLWEVRESGLGATAWVPGEPRTHPGWEDAAVPPEKVGDYLKSFRELCDRYDFKPSLYGHFGQGCIHCRIGFDLRTSDGIEKYRKFTKEASDLVVSFGGSNSGEHGDGQARGDLVENMFGPKLMQAFKEFKTAWDPDWKMNPGKILKTDGRTRDLRLGTGYDPPQLKTHFSFVNENFSFAEVSDRCVGVGKCRRHEEGTMCPSYMVTREEEHSTRGRARMLYEMMEGEVLKGGWKNKEVKESLDLCLACKGCKADCPVNVDMATYKAEFLSHYYEGRLRPRTAYAFGYIYWLARLASLIPRIANYIMHAPVIAPVAKMIAGVASKRKMPKFSEITFRQWFREREPANNDKPEVIVWADTFNNFFLPETLVAGVNVLEAAGFKVILTKKILCCGRPLYDFGMLKLAKKMLKEILNELNDEIVKGTPVVGFEPSCVAVFKDELHNMFPHDEQAKRLEKQVFTLSEFLEKKAPDFKIPHIENKVVVHGHCHHKAVMKMDSEKTILKKAGIDFSVLDSGCCGMAGYFGYEKGDHYDVSVKAGERVLLPAVRKATDATVIVADGFSCREQIEQQTTRKGLHTAQLLQMALEEQDNSFKDFLPEKKYVDDKKLDASRVRRKRISAGIMFGVVIATAAVIIVSVCNNTHEHGKKLMTRKF